MRIGGVCTWDQIAELIESRETFVRPIVFRAYGRETILELDTYL
jgi:hypothetical protein